MSSYTEDFESISITFTRYTITSTGTGGAISGEVEAEAISTRSRVTVISDGAVSVRGTVTAGATAHRRLVCVATHWYCSIRRVF